MGKWLIRIAIVLAALLLVAAIAVYLGAPWAVERFLRREIAIGEGSLKVSNPAFRWNLDLTADSLRYGGPGLEARAQGVRASVNLFRSLFRFSPSLDLDVAAADLRFKAVDDSLEEKVEKPEEKGPPAFKDFDIPASLKARIGRLHAAGDTADIGTVVGVLLENDGKRALRLRIDSLVLPGRPGGPARPAAPPLRLSMSAGLDWRDGADLKATLEADLSGALGGDGARLSARARKEDLRRADLEIETRVAALSRYAFLLGTSPYVAGAGGWQGTIKANLDAGSGRAGYKAGLVLDGRFGGLSGKLPVVLSPQRLAVRLDFGDSAGTWSVRSAGKAGESVDLSGTLAATARDSLRNPAWLGRHLAVTMAGKAGGIPVTAAGKTVKAELVVREARYAPGGRADLLAVTGDGSEVRASLAEGKRGWNGTFKASVAPGEAWLAAFADTNVAFRSFTAAGRVEDGRVRAVTEALYLSAYGLLADTLVASHRYDSRGYVLEAGKIMRAGTTWNLSGRVDLARRNRPLAFKADGGPAGSVELRMDRPDLIEATVRGLAPHRIPYRGLDTLAAYALRLGADFRWDRTAREGAARLDAEGRYKDEGVKASARAAWDRERLEVAGLDADLGGSRARVSGAVRLKGRQFYELKGLGLPDLDSVTLAADRFDLARAARLAGPEPAVTAGTLAGRFRYSPDRGFEGAYRVEGLQAAAAADLAVLKDLRLAGDGDTLRILAVTVSKKEPLLNDTLRVFLSGALEERQTLGLDARVGPTLALGFRGGMRSFRDLEGIATLEGSLELPGKSGSLRALRLRALVSTPFKEALANLRVEADTLMGEYVVPGIDTQAISAPLRVAGGRLVVPDLVLRGRSGSSVRGRVEYAFAGDRALQAQLAGGGLVVQAGGDKALLRDLSVTARLDTASVAVDARAGYVSFEHVKPPLRAAGDLSRVRVSYRSPLGKPQAPLAEAAGAGSTGSRSGRPGRAAAVKEVPAVLKVSAVLDTSQIRYRLRTFTALSGVFKRSPRAPKRTARASRPLEVSVDVQTSGSGNSVETDVLRFGYVGDFSLRGVMPYALVNGRVTGTTGELGTKKQAYTIRNLEVKWFNSAPEEGTLEVEAAKRLAGDCSGTATDSCSVITRLVGTLAEPQFAYDSDCEGAFGAGANVPALLYSVRRGCYSNLSSGGSEGLSYQEQALALLEPLASQYLTRYASKFTSNWIETADISGLGALAQDKEKSKAPDSGAAAAREAIALEVLSKEFWRLRMRLKAGYQPQDVQETDPWAYRMGLEWKPPLFRLVEDPQWKRRIKNNVVVEAAVYRDPAQAAELNDNSVQRRLGLNYNYDWWGHWWGKGGASSPGPAGTRDSAPAPGAAPARSREGSAGAPEPAAP